MNRRLRVTQMIVFSLMAVCVSMTIAAELLPPAAEKAHAALVKQLDGDQQQAVAALYPGYKILAACSGRLSGGARDELVLGIWAPGEKSGGETKQGSGDVRRIGLIWNNGWQVHRLDAELALDRARSHASKMLWETTLDERGFTGELKCGGDLGHDADLSDGKGKFLDRKPFFDLKDKNGHARMPVCFASSDVYNNWDCVAYDAQARRFRLWYQQVHAD